MTSQDIPSIMRAPRFIGGGAINLVEKPVPEPGPGQLLIRVAANALCGSERGQFMHGAAVTPGHEAAGIVCAAGPDTRTAIGTPGVIFLMDFCGACRSCTLGLTNQCLQKRGDMGFNKDGGYGAYELINETIFFPIDPDIPLDEATMLLDVMGTTHHAFRRAQLVHPDIQSLLIAGAGPIGLGTLAMAKVLFGPEFPVILFDIAPFRLELAERLGGRAINSSTEDLEQGMRRHGLPAVDLAIDTSGRSVARQACVHALNRRGVLVCVGHGEGLSLSVSPDLIANERAILGSEYLRYDELPASLALLRAHRPYLRQIITHRFAVGQIQQAFELFFSGQTGKVVVEQ